MAPPVTTVRVGLFPLVVVAVFLAATGLVTAGWRSCPLMWMWWRVGQLHRMATTALRCATCSNVWVPAPAGA